MPDIYTPIDKTSFIKVFLCNLKVICLVILPGYSQGLFFTFDGTRPGHDHRFPSPDLNITYRDDRGV